MRNVIEEFENKRVLIWGYGREGQSTERFLKNLCKTKSVEIYEGKLDGIDIEAFDYIIKSPGIVMEEDHPKFISQTEIFLSQFGSQVIGVTGTKGKSTTSSLLYHVLSKSLDRQVLLLGNIGVPCLDHFAEIDDDTLIVFEMSCHQLAHGTVSPHISLFLNLFEEHLDYYKTVDKYFAAKSHIATYQKEGDYFLVGDNVPHIDTKANVFVIDSSKTYDYELSLKGEHNQYNSHFVHTVACDILGIDDAVVREHLKTFTGLPHRLEDAGTYDGVHFFDDSISTIPEATIRAIESLSDTKTVLVGGMDRGINYDVLIEYVKMHSEYNYVFMYESGKRIYESVKSNEYCYLVSDLLEAVKLAKKLTKSGETCVLSPAAASYGYFKNFEERGDVFKEYCRTL